MYATQDKSERVSGALLQKRAFSFVLPWISLRGGAQVRAPIKHVNAQDPFTKQLVEVSCLYLEFDPSSG